MAFLILDTPRTDVNDLTRLTTAMDFTTETSIPSPSKENNDLLKQMRGTRGQPLATPHQHRAPFVERRNVPAKTEFTPLLKSATRNNAMRGSLHGGVLGREGTRPMQTPVGLRASYRGNSPGLPAFGSSVIIEENTENSVNPVIDDGTPVPQVISSSVLSTPAVLQSRRADGVLDGGNLATLREQEARLEQIDKENFSLKLKIHFLEEALRRNGKDFNEAAVKENTELKVDKVTLQRDLKHYRKCLALAEKNLEEYKRQLQDYVEKVKKRHAQEGMEEELESLRQGVASKEEEVEQLKQQLESAGSNDQLEKLQGDITDLEAELRAKDRELDEKDDQLEALAAQSSGQQNELLEERDQEIQRLHEELERVSSESEQKLQGKNQAMAELRNRVEATEAELKEAREELDSDKSTHVAEIRRLNRTVEDKDYQIHSLEQKLEGTPADADFDKLREQIDDLEVELREKDMQLDEGADKLDQQETQAREERQAVENDLRDAEGRIQELEDKQSQNLKELQALRNTFGDASTAASESLRQSQARVQELEQERDAFSQQYKDLQADIHRLQDEIDRLQDEIQDVRNQHAIELAAVEKQKRALESPKNRAEQHVRELNATVDTLKNSQGSLSERESALQRALETEKRRHEADVAALEKEFDEAVEHAEKQQNALNETKAALITKERELVAALEKQQELEDTIQSLEDEVEVLQSGHNDRAGHVQVQDDIVAARREADSLRRQVRGLQQDLAKAETEHENIKAELEVLLDDQKITPRSPQSPNRELRLQIKSLESQLEAVKKEKFSLQDKLSTITAELDTIRSQLSESTSSHDAAQRECRTLRTQLQTQAHEHERKIQTQITAYEQDILNLETDLLSRQDKLAQAETKQHTSDQQISRLRTKIQSLESQLNALRLQDHDRDTTSERQELHDLLKKSKLDFEDLALQLRNSDAHLAAATRRESELHAKLKRANATTPSAGTEKRHAAELKGLVKQIEYLAARLRREESFRADLAHTKEYFQRTVEMHAKCTRADIKLVRAMGVPVKNVRAQQEEAEMLAKGRVIVGAGKDIRMRPSLKVVGTMVRAVVRMRNAAGRWAEVKKGHDKLLKTLEGVRRERERR